MTMGKLQTKCKEFGQELYRKRILWLMILPTIIFFIIFAYIPMPGAYVAFVDYHIGKGIFGSNFVGLKNFEFLAKTGELWRITKNTFLYNVAFIVIGNVVQVILAIMISEIKNKWFKKVSQSVILLPYFISMVIVGYFAYNMFNYNSGFINSALTSLGLAKHDFYSDTRIWKYVIVAFKVWSGTGYGMIVYLATITGFSEDIYEAAALDGASAFKKIRYITLPMLKPTVITLVMLNVGRIMYSDFGLFYQVPMDSGALYSVTNTIDTYVYRCLMTLNNISTSSAACTYQAIVGFILVLVVNTIVRRKDKENALF